jgi:superfamily I DNA/RNA helicase
VLIARCSYTAFPSRLSVAEDNLDEERRLFYVALTRAADTLTVCEAPWLGDGGRGRHWADFLEDADVRAHFRKSI